MGCSGNCNCEQKRCHSCKFYTQKTSVGFFGHHHKYWTCENPETIHQFGGINETWWSDGSKIALAKGSIDELLVGCNFGCVNWEKKEDDC